MRMFRLPPATRRGFTLVELLVAMSIAVVLIAIALPLAKFSIEEGRSREASRQLNAFLSRAKAQAAFTGRPHGVWIERDPLDATRATQCFLAEVPPPFGGAVTDAKVKFSGGMLNFVMADGTTPDGNSQAIISTLFPQAGLGFGIRFDFKGPVFTGTSTATGLSLPSGPQNLDPNRGYPYQIYRLPQKISNIDIELPKGTFISLEQSGVGAAGTEFNFGNNPVVLMFAPSGVVSSVHADGLGSPVPNSTIHFLVARLRADNPPPSVLEDSNNYWVSTGNLTGTIATSEVGYDGAGNMPTIADGSLTVAESRFYAIRYDQKGGR